MPLAVPIYAQSAFWIIVAVQIVGLASAWLARSSVGCRRQRPCQLLFLSCLMLVGVATIVAMGISAASWLFSSVTLALMVVAAVWDCGGDSSAETA